MLQAGRNVYLLRVDSWVEWTHIVFIHLFLEHKVSMSVF